MEHTSLHLVGQLYHKEDYDKGTTINEKGLINLCKIRGTPER